MCGKKLTNRDGGPDEPRRQFIDTSVFYWEYLNNSLNYILSGANDLDHVVQFDNAALRQIIATDPGQESIHFVERTRMMKTRCDPANYLKDIQQYGEFINSDLSRATHQEIKNIEEELQEEFDLGILIKRLRKKYRKLEERLTLYQVDQLQKQMKNSILNGLVDDQQNMADEEDKHLDENRLYREMFNIQERHVKEEKIEVKKPERLRSAKAGSKKKATDDFVPSSTKNKETLPVVEKTNVVVSEKMVEQKVKKEENIDKNPIKYFPAHLPTSYPFIIETIQSNTTSVPVARSQQSSVVPFVPPKASVGRPPLSSNSSTRPVLSAPQFPPVQTVPPVPVVPAKPAFIIQKLEPIVIQPSQPMIISKTFPRDNEANLSSNVSPSAEPLSKATDSEKKAKKEKKIDKDKDKEKDNDKDKEKKRSKGRPKEDRQKQRDKEKDDTKREKRPYNRKQTHPAKSQDIRFPVAQLQTIIPIATIFDRRPLLSSAQIGIQAVDVHDNQSWKVITPRILTEVKTEPQSTKPAQQEITQERPLEASIEMVPEPRVEPVENQASLLSNSSQFDQRSATLPVISASGLLASQRMDIQGRIDPAPLPPTLHLTHPQQPHDPSRKKDDFNIDDYLV